MSQIMRLQDFYKHQDSDVTDDMTVAVAADALAIPVTHAIVNKTTGGDAEALTIVDGKPGQLLTILLVFRLRFQESYQFVKVGEALFPASVGLLQRSAPSFQPFTW